MPTRRTFITFALVALVGCASKSEETIDSAKDGDEVEGSKPTKSDPTDGLPAYGVDSGYEYPSYSEICSNPEPYMGEVFLISGRVTHVNDSILLMKKRREDDNIFAYVFWDESNTIGEVAVVRIPYSSYDSSINRYFSGRCVFEGINEKGHPQFVGYDYVTKRPKNE